MTEVLTTNSIRILDPDLILLLDESRGIKGDPELIVDAPIPIYLASFTTAETNPSGSVCDGGLNLTSKNVFAGRQDVLKTDQILG